MDNYFEMYMAERCKAKALEKIIAEYESGKRFLKLQKDYRLVCNGYIREIDRLKSELADSHAHAISIRNMWTDECYNNYDEYRAEIRQKDETIRRLEDRIWEIQRKHDKKVAALTTEYEDKLHERDVRIEELTRKLARAEALLNTDGTNAGIPTSQTPLGKKKHIPNGRKKSGRTKGGQPGHEKHVLETPGEDTVTDTIKHDPIEDGLVCPSCDGDIYVFTGKYEVKFEKDVELVTKTKKHVYYYYLCTKCGVLFRSEIAPNLKEKVQYGNGVQALALSLMNTVNAPINKVVMFIEGITAGKLTPSEGYIAKLQERAAKNLKDFRKDLKAVLVTRALIYWDDTVIMIHTERACCRFYGDETIAYYTAHMHKDMASIEEDDVLALLGTDTKVMHDHNTINYNPRFIFQNLDCIQHLERDLQKNTDDTGNEWSYELKATTSETIKDRKEAIDNGETSFGDDYIKEFHRKIDECLEKGWKQNEKAPEKYGAAFERALLRRIEKYRQNYYGWVEDFSLPTTDNLSERALRGIKSHMKISGQFESEKAADNYALIRSYIETCRRNKINEIEALKRAVAGNPFTVSEIFGTPPP